MFYVKLDTNEFIVVQLITEFMHPDTNTPHLLLYADDFIITPADSVELLTDIPFKYAVKKGSHIIAFNNKKHYRNYPEWEVIK